MARVGWQDEVEVTVDGLIAHVAGLVARVVDGGVGPGASVEEVQAAWGEPEDSDYDDEDGGELFYERDLDDDASIAMNVLADGGDAGGVTRVTVEARWDEAEAEAWRARGLAWMAALEESLGAPRRDERDDEPAAARWDDGASFATLEVTLDDGELTVVVEGVPEPEGSLWGVLRSHAEIAEYLAERLTGEGVPEFGFAGAEPGMDCDALIAHLGAPRRQREDDDQGREVAWSLVLDHDELGRRDRARLELSALPDPDDDAVGTLELLCTYYGTGDSGDDWDALVARVKEALEARYGKPERESRGASASLEYSRGDRGLYFKWSAGELQLRLAWHAPES